MKFQLSLEQNKPVKTNQMQGNFVMSKDKSLKLLDEIVFWQCRTGGNQKISNQQARFPQIK